MDTFSKFQSEGRVKEIEWQCKCNMRGWNLKICLNVEIVYIF